MSVRGNDGTTPILKEIISGAIDSPETYSELFEMALEEFDKSLIVQALKNKYNEIGKPDLLDLLENIAFYDQFTSDERFKKWLEVSKKFLLALDNAPEKRNEFVSYWQKYSKKENDNSISYKPMDRLAFANLVLFIRDYLGIKE
jgi:hypothetical protein